MDIRRSESDGLQSLADLASKTPDAELEAMLIQVDLTAWQDVIQYLRHLGMKERTNLLKLNISFKNNIRITLEGTGIIKDYCRENRIGEDMPFKAMRKEHLQGVGAEPVVLEHYGVRTKLKRETALDNSDAEVLDMLKRWDSLDKHFRLIQRFEFDAPGDIPLRFDISHVRENEKSGRRSVRTLQESRCMTAPAKYEVEVELTRVDNPDASVRHLVRGISWLLQGRQRSYVLVSSGGVQSVRTDIQRIFSSSSAASASATRGAHAPFRYPAPQPATLERHHLLQGQGHDVGVPQLTTFPGGYNVTDKADGLRAMLYVAQNGRLFLVDAGGRVYATGKEVASTNAGTVLDGEWIRRNRAGAQVSAYYAFDILAAAKGDTRVAALPFAIAGEMMGTRADRGTRRAALADAVRALAGAVQKVRGVPANQNLQVGMKTFRVSGTGVDSLSIFRDCAAATLSDAKAAPYTTDGLIFTPNSPGLPLGRGTWHQQLKWKPAHENTIDFLVLVDSERDAEGAPTGVDATKTMYREDSAQTVRYKTLRLFVGSNQDVAFKDPRRTIVSGDALPSENAGPGPGAGAGADWRATEFRPMEPRDSMAAICYVEVADAALGSSVGDMNGIRAKSGDVLQSDMIVEMSYHPERSPGWRWMPVRVRHDKTERWHNKNTSGTMNADWVADSIWSNIHNPVTEAAVTTGIVEGCVAPRAATMGVRKSRGRDLVKLQCMMNFQNDCVKRLLFSPAGTGSTVFDMACGAADDLSRWLSIGVASAVGIDTHADRINDPAFGAYRRLLDKTIVLQERMPIVRFAVADPAQPLSSAGASPEDQEILVAREFDMVRMDRVADMFQTADTLSTFLSNLSHSVRMGGFVAGFNLDGDAVARLLVTHPTVSGKDGSVAVWSISKQYDAGSNIEGTGFAINIEMETSQTQTEYLVSWSYFQSRMASAGFTLLTADDTKPLGLPASSQMFSETLKYAEAIGQTYPMSDAFKQLSFLHRWWIFKRTGDVISTSTPIPAVAPTPAKTKRDGVVATPVVATPVAPTKTKKSKKVTEGPQLEIEETTPTPTPTPTPSIVATPVAVAASASTKKSKKGTAAIPHDPRPFILNGAIYHDPEERLGAEFADWPHYMSTSALTEINDVNPTGSGGASSTPLTYPSLDAAFASEKYQKATNKPELGAAMFGVKGTLHQTFVTKRAAATTDDERKKLIGEEAATIRMHSSKNKMKALGAIFRPEAWDHQKPDVFSEYIRKRYLYDVRFHDMVDAIKARGGTVELVEGADADLLAAYQTIMR